MGALARVNAALAEQRTVGGVPWRPWDSPDWSFGIGGPVHPTKATGGGIDGALSLQPVYSAVRILAEGVAQLPIQQYRDTGDRKVKMPLGQLLSKPSAYLNRFDWLYQYVSSAALTGTAFGLITTRDGYGYPTTVEWLPPDQMAVLEGDQPGQARIFFRGREMSRGELLIIRAFTVPGRTAGISPLAQFQQYIAAGVDALSYGADWYRAGGFPPGTFQNMQYEVDDEQSAKIKAKLVGAMRRREPLVYGRDWDYKPVSVPPNEAQFIDAMRLNAEQIAAIYGVPPHKVGGSRAGGGDITYSNAEAEQIGFVQDSLDPWLVRFEAAMLDCLPAQQYAQFNRNARVRTDITTRFGAYRLARDIGIMNVDEIRELEDLAPLQKENYDNDYDGSDYTPLAIQVAAARGTKQLIGEGVGGQQPAAQPLAKAPAAGSVPGPAPVGPHLQPAPVPAANGNGNGHRPADG